MRIEGPNSPETRRPDELAHRHKARRNDAHGNRDTFVTEPAEHVRVSSKAHRLADMRRDERVHDDDRVERLKQALQNGTFQVDADRIADRMLEEES